LATVGEDFNVLIRTKSVLRDTYDSFFTLPFTQTVVQQNQLKLIVYNPEKQELVLWQS
jgi:hypothetical protein